MTSIRQTNVPLTKSCLGQFLGAPEMGIDSDLSTTIGRQNTPAHNLSCSLQDQSECHNRDEIVLPCTEYLDTREKLKVIGTISVAIAKGDFMIGWE
jgi:hypothetical protein